MKIAVVTDSCLAMTKKEAQEKGIFLFPLQLLCGDESYLDGVNITISEFETLLKEGHMPTTSCPPIGLVEEGFQEIKDLGYDAIICIPITRALSATAENFEVVARDLGIKFKTIDLYTTCKVQYYVTMKVKEMIDAGLEFDTIVQIAQDSIPTSNTLIIPDDLSHLKRGGRLTPLAARFASLLKIKPILSVNESTKGMIDVYAKVRTSNKAFIKAIDDLNEKIQGSDDYLWYVIHADATEAANSIVEMIKERTGCSNVSCSEMPPVILAHAGLQCIGIQCIKKISF